MANTLFDAVKETSNATTTTNGMAAWKSSLNKVLDLFAKGSSYRKNPNGITNLVREAYVDDKLNTLRCLFYLRDIRGNGGQGERDVFRAGIREFARLNTKLFIESNIIRHIPMFGRWDDLFCLFDISEELDHHVMELIKKQWRYDFHAVSCRGGSLSLMAKWLPSCNTSSEETRRLAKKIRKGLGLTERTYRKALSNLRKEIDILETHLTNKDYTFDYSTIPSNANMKYRKCFYTKDGERYKAHVDAVTKAIENGETNTKGAPKDNVKTLYPYEIVKKICDSWITNTEEKRLENMWKQLPNYFGGDSARKNWLTVIDTSGSMTWGSNPIPMDVAISLGLYIGERNTGIFKDKYITFSERPSFVSVNSDWSLRTKVRHIMSNSIVANTNIERVFKLVLDAAVKHNLPVSEMPEAIVIISDMQFDQCVEDGNNPTVYTMINNMYERAGYPVPKLVFWNASQCDYGNLPVTQHQYGAVLVGGCKPGMFEQILSGKTPADFMLKVLSSERYSVINLEE